MKAVKPKYFLLENVKMKKEFQDIISEQLGVEPIEINSSLVSAQSRKRLYWTNLSGIEPPEDKGILLKDIVFEDALFCGRVVGRARENGKRIDHKQSVAGLTTQEFEPRVDNKTGVLSTVQKDNLLLTKKALEYMDREVKGGRTHWDFKHHSDVKEPKSAAVVANFFRSKTLPFDFYLPSSTTIIECHGIQHYKPVPYWGGHSGFIDRNIRDMIKKNFCRNNNLRFIEISYLDFKKRVVEKTLDNVAFGV